MGRNEQINRRANGTIGTKKSVISILLGNYRIEASADSTVRVLSLSHFCPDFSENRVRCLSAVRILSGNP